MTQPRYQNIASQQIPEIHRKDGVKIRVIAGDVDGIRGPVTEIAADPIYLDVAIPTGGFFSHPIEKGHAAFAYIFEGQGVFGTNSEEKGARITHPRLVILGDGDYIGTIAENQPVRFLLVSGKPLNEPIARYGPFVMNTREEIEQALEDLRRGTFVQN